MNLQAVTQLAEYLKMLPDERFEMSSWWYTAECGTVGCIAGHAVALLDPKFMNQVEEDGRVELGPSGLALSGRAEELLGLPSALTFLLFNGYWITYLDGLKLEWSKERKVNFVAGGSSREAAIRLLELTIKHNKETQ